MGYKTVRARHSILLRLILLLSLYLFSSEYTTDAAHAGDRFEVYCDGLGIFLSDADGAPAPGKLVLFTGVSFPPGIVGILQEKWSAAYALADGCVPDETCKSIGKGKVWIDKWDDDASVVPKQISGKYEIEVDGKKLQGTFVAKLFSRKRPLRLCV